MKKQFFIILSILILSTQLYSQTKLLTIEQKIELIISNQIEIDIDELLLLQDKFKELYIFNINESNNRIKNNQLERKNNDLKGGMMILAGALSIIGGSLSFYLSELYYEKYNQAETTASAISYRNATQSLDFFKFFLTTTGVSVAAASSFYFTSGADRNELALSNLTGKKTGGIFFVR